MRGAGGAAWVWTALALWGLAACSGETGEFGGPTNVSSCMKCHNGSPEHDYAGPGVYPVSLAQYLMGGPPTQVWGQQSTEFGIDMHFAGQMAYGGGRTAHFTCTFDSAFQTRAEIRGTMGRLELTRPFTGIGEPDRSMKFFPKQGDPEEISIENVNEYLDLGEVNDMHAAILDGEPNYLTAKETRNHIKTVLALYRSARENRLVTLDEL